MHVYKLKVDKPDHRDILFSIDEVAALPPMVDLRPHCSPVVDQGELGSCTANAIVSGLREYLELKAGEKLIPLSRLFLYYEERVLENTVAEDSGAYIRDGMKVMNQIGVCPEFEVPYNIAQFTVAPTPKQVADARPFVISEYHRVTSLNLMKAALAGNQPVVIGINVYESFESAAVAKTGIVPTPKAKEKLLGGHAVCAVGYDDKKSWAIVRNSWGASWGDKGYFYLPYTYFTKNVTDMWTGHV